MIVTVLSNLTVKAKFQGLPERSRWEKRSERSQNERLDPKGRKKSRTSVFATKAPAVDQDTQHVTGTALPWQDPHKCHLIV